MRREGKRICESPTQKCFGLWPAIHRDPMVTDVDNAHGAGAGGSVGAGVGASDVGDVETGNGTAVTTMTTTMTLTLMPPSSLPIGPVISDGDGGGDSDGDDRWR